MDFVDDEELERRLEIARKRGAPIEEVNRVRDEYKTRRASQQKPKKSLSSKVGGFVLDSLKEMALGATATPRFAVTATSQLLKEPFRRSLQAEYQKLRSQPAKTQEDLDKRRELAQRIANMSETPLLRKKEQEAIGKGVGHGTLQGAKAGVDTASFVASLLQPSPATLLKEFPEMTTKQLAKKALLPQAMIGMGTGFARSGDTAEETVGGTVIGAGEGLASGLLNMGAGKLANFKGGSKSVSPKGKYLKTTPQLANQVDEMGEVAEKFGITKGLRPLDKIKKAEAGIEDLEGRILESLKKDPTPVDESLVLNKFTESLENVGLDETTPTGRRAVTRVLEEISETGGDKIKLNALKTKYRKMLGGSLSKMMSGETNQPPMRQAEYAGWEAISDILDTVDDQIKGYRHTEKVLYDIANELGKNYQQGGRIPVPIPGTVEKINTPISLGNASADVNRIGSGLWKGTVNATGKLGSVATAPILTPLLVQETTNGGEKNPNEVVYNESGENLQGHDTYSSTGINIKTPYDVYSGKATRNDWIISNDGKRIWNPQEQKFIAYDPKVFGAPAKSDATAKEVANIKRIYDEVKASGGTGLVGGTVSSALGKVKLNAKAAAYEREKEAFLSLVARAAGEKGALAEGDVNRIRHAFPSLNDPEPLAQELWYGLGLLLNSMEEKYGMTPGTLGGGLE